MSTNNIAFCPVRGVQQAIDNHPISEGFVYYAYDTGKIYLDKNNVRYTMSGGAANGASFYYGNFNKKIEPEGTPEYYYYPKESVELTEEAAPRIDDIILDEAGFLYRIKVIENDNYACLLLPLSGSGGGEKINRPSLTLSTYNSVLVNGQAFSLTVLAKSALGEDNLPLAPKLNIHWTLVDSRTNQTYYNGIPVEVDHNVSKELSLGDYLKPSTDTIVRLYATGINHDQQSATREAPVSTVEMKLQQTSSYHEAYTYERTSTTLYCNAIGNLSKVLCWYIDGTLRHKEVLASNSTNPRSFTVPPMYIDHGHHLIEVKLYQNLGSMDDPVLGLESNILKYEIAVIDTQNGNDLPIIWLGDYKESYYNYDTIQIPFLVYNPTNTSQAEVHLYKNDVEIEGSPRTIKEFTEFSYWQIADADLDKENYYSITCGPSEEYRAHREIRFIVTKDPLRDMTIKSDNLKLNFDPTGRSNSEPATKRASWSYKKDENTTINGIFENFNWYNNGWFTDADTKNTFLRISNGAKFTIPFDPLTFGTSETSQQSNTLEFAFKMRNIQNYTNLITNITRYVGDDTWYNNFLAQTEYLNYDAYLQATLNSEDYENLKFNRVQKNINLSNIACGFYSGSNESTVGVCIGSQDAFFSNGSDTISIPFVENEMVYLSFVYNHELRLLFIYINGVITGVIESTADQSSGFKINSDKIEFTSNVCDIDLYKIRIYGTSLSVNDIVKNHAVDKKDIIIYDQNGLAVENNSLKEYQLSFDNIDDYILKHPELPLMPYIVFDTSVNSSMDDKLPYAKIQGAQNIQVEFINTPLDTAYARGELNQKAIDDGLLSKTESDQTVIQEAIKTYYKHNCPSWTSTMSVGDMVTIEVQGTSSEFYPRRNFKIKTKFEKPNCWDDELKDDEGNAAPGYSEEDCLNIYMHKGPFEDIYKQDVKNLTEDAKHYYGYEQSRMADGWYMNNYTNPTDRWTMKVDYMESSGSYNAGFASLVGTAYTKHPLKDYVDKGLLTNTDKLESDIFEGSIRWQDFRTSLLGFPVMAFQKRKKDGGGTEHLFIGYYRMLLDKGSEEVLGFKTHKNITHKLFPKPLEENKPQEYERIRDIAECWEFSTNARTFCSYRDPWKRVEFSFKAPASENTNAFIKLESGALGGPVVLNHFEPRYFWAEDYLKNDEDGFYNFGNLQQSKVDEICAEIGIDAIDVNAADAAFKAQDAAVYLMRNWEKVCKWIYSTNLDDVASQGTYNIIPVGKELYEKGKFYIIDENNTETGYSISNDDFDPSLTYYTLATKTDEITNESYQTYENAYATLEQYKYVANKFYIEISGAYSLCTDAEFDSSKTYYEFISLPDEEIAKKADLLVAPATEFISGTTYYTYNSDAKVNPGSPTGAVSVVSETVTADTFSNNNYYVASPKTYGGTTYKYDTKEYRTAKFINELEDHFDLEYLATYFIMTEVFECYDSRGKNCMMASWGPQVNGGDYIWYPIFYDIDTQLGINNTGIPSFEFNVDATEAGNYSTSDSILWNNFYKFFKGSVILNKYKNLRSQKSSFTDLRNPPLKDVNTLEKWYTFDEKTTGNIANRGYRPLIATNLDMYFKYITITNKNAMDQGVAYIPGADGKYAIDKAGSYFYALQGDRSQSRRQFLTNRLEYIDSWLNQGNYARGGNNRIRGRISANSKEQDSTTSDIWVEDNNNSYWKNNIEFGTKNHDFDAEYWLTLKPIRSSYVTAGDDSANYPSQKYTGLKDINFKLSDIESGVRRSRNYPEQLVYIYGMNQMSDYGNMNNLYWTEFYMEGQADHLTRLQLGYDGYSKTESGNYGWFNKKLNDITLTSMPLLKEANFSNIGIQNQTSLDFTASEKLENFRATGTSNLTGVQFADGVALNTLYLPESVVNLKLVQANLLDTIITSETVPRPVNNEDGSVTPPPQGLYIEGFFSNQFSSSLTNINLDGGSLGHGSYVILKHFYDVIKDKQDSGQTGQTYRITMTDVNWSPYVQLTEGAVYDGTNTYYIDNKHYGFDRWQKDASKFNDLVLNGQLYIKQEVPEIKIGDDVISINDDCITMLNNLYDEPNLFANAASTNAHPNISGIIYINNVNTILEESIIREKMQPKYPNLTFFFEKVDKAYSAEFLYQDPVSGVYKYVPFIDGTAEPSVQKISKQQYENNNNVWFKNPFNLYNPKRTHYNFIGWSLNPNADPDGNEVIKKDDDWASQTIDPDKYDYIYYAIFKITQYEVQFYDGNGEILATKKYDYGTTGITTPDDKVPYLNDSELDLMLTYGFKGYTDNKLTNKLIDAEKFVIRGETKLYPVFEEMSVYDNVHPEYFSIKSDVSSSDGSTKGWIIDLVKNVRGKITIPTRLTNSNGITRSVYTISNSFNPSNKGADLTHVFFERDTEIRAFAASAFGVSQSDSKKSLLQFIEFPDSLETIGNQAFSRCSNLNFASAVNYNGPTEDAPRIRGNNVRSIGEQAFAQAFASGRTIEILNIGPRVTTISQKAFQNMGLRYTKIKIGNNINKSDLDFQYNAGSTFVFNNGGGNSYSVEFYSNLYTVENADSLKPFFQGCDTLSIR